MLFFIIVIFSYLHKIKKVWFLVQISEMEILMDFHVLRFPESENQVLAVNLRVCMSFISINPNQIATEVPNLVFYICSICRCYLKHFMNIG